MDDCQLLEDYTERGSETAFRTLVNRHLSFVYSAAFRQVNDPQLAEEVSQAVFILLARKAGSFRQSVVLTGWLFRTTRFVATRALRSEQRRQRREQEAFEMQQLTTPDDNWRRIAPVLDEAVARLGETERNAVLLRFFNDKSHRETAAALGISEAAAKKRVTRALDKLRNFFAGRGVTLSATVLTSAIAANAAKAATPEISASVIAKVIAGGSTAAGVLPPLVSQTLNAWRWAKLGMSGAVGITAITAAFVIQWTLDKQNQSARTDKPNIALAAPAVTDAKPNALDQAVSPLANSEATNSLVFRVLDARTDEGVTGATVAVNYVTKGNWWAGDDLVTDAQGICSIPIPGELDRLDVGFLKEGYIQKSYVWREAYEEPLPSVYILKAERGVAIGGWVRDESGQPISGAEIVVQLHASDSTFREQPGRLGFLRKLVAAKTDAQGRWKCAIVPAGYESFSLGVRHPQYATSSIFVVDAEGHNANISPNVTMTDLSASEAIIILRRGFQVTGVVLDDMGQPMAGAKVSLFADSGFSRDEDTVTKTNGAFHFAGLAAGTARICASASGFAPVSQAIEIQSILSKVVLRLQRGTTVSFRVVGEQGSGISGAWVIAEGWQQHNANWYATSDEHGWVRIEGVPETARNNLRFHSGAKGFFINRSGSVNLLAPEPQLYLSRALKVSGRVVDADSGEPIASFKAIPCRGDGEWGYDRSERIIGTNGNFTVTFSEFDPPFRVRIEADGYEPAMSSIIPLEPREQSVDFKLHLKDPSKAIRGMVLLPDGQPAVGADVALLTFERGAVMGEGRFDRQEGGILTRTDNDGKFEFDPDANAHTVAAAQSSGFGRTRIREGDQAVVVQLLPWGRIEGRVRTRDGKWSGQALGLYAISKPFGLYVRQATKSDAEGRFSLESVPPGDYDLHLNPGVGTPVVGPTPVEVRAGETTETQVGGSDVTITGRLELASGGMVDWPQQTKLSRLEPKARANPPPFPLPSQMDPRYTDLAERRKHLDVVETDVWRAWTRSQQVRAVPLRIEAAGSFIADSVCAGEYTLRVELAADAAVSRGNPMASIMRPTIASIRQSVIVSETQAQAGEFLELGTLVLQPEVQEKR
jgi:RNA polymerase sigma factor (sigma-70 family)